MTAIGGAAGAPGWDPDPDPDPEDRQDDERPVLDALERLAEELEETAEALDRTIHDMDGAGESPDA